MPSKKCSKSQLKAPGIWIKTCALLFTGESEPEFEAILDQVDPNRDMFISLQDYMAYMITKETENVATSDEIVNAFQVCALSELLPHSPAGTFEVGRNLSSFLKAPRGHPL